MWCDSGGRLAGRLQSKPFFYVASVSRLGGSKKCVLMPSALPLTDVPDPLQQQLDRGSNRHPLELDDVVCLVKKFISEPQLSQKPLLVMTRKQAEGIPNIPADRHPLRTVSNDIKSQWAKLANFTESFYGERYRPAAIYLRGLINDEFCRNAQLVDVSWLRNNGVRFAGEAQVNFHKCVLDTLAPSQPLRAVWARR